MFFFFFYHSKYMKCDVDFTLMTCLILDQPYVKCLRATCSQAAAILDIAAVANP